MAIILQVGLNEISKEYLDAYGTLVNSQSKFWVWLLIGLGVQVVSSIGSLVIQLRLKALDKKLTKFNLREERRIKVYEEVYRQMVNLTWFIPGDPVQSLIQKVDELEDYIQIQNIYISGEVNNILTQYLDHFRVVIAVPNKKNIATESALLERYYQSFNE